MSSQKKKKSQYRKFRRQWLNAVLADLNQLLKTFNSDQSSRGRRICKMAGLLEAQVQAAQKDTRLSLSKIDRNLRRLMAFVANPEHL